MKKEERKSRQKNWLTLINIPIQMGVIIFAFAYLGNWLDDNASNSKIYYHKLLILVGVAIALYNVFRQVNEINRN